MPNELKGSDVKRAWLADMAELVGPRGFRKRPDGFFRRREGGRDSFSLVLHPAGRGETDVTLDPVWISVTLDTVAELVAELHQEKVDLTRAIRGVPLVDLVPADQHETRQVVQRSSCDTLEGVRERNTRLLEVLDAYAEPWWQRMRDLPQLLVEAQQNPRGKNFDALESVAALAFVVGDRDAVERALADYDAELDSRGRLPALNHRVEQLALLRRRLLPVTG